MTSWQERFWDNVDCTGDGCWEWNKSLNGKGYAYFGMNGKMYRAHRVSYELAHGEISAGMQIDHLCRNRACVRPDHLEAVTSKQNTLRGEGIAAVNSKKTHCIHGHEFTPDNVIERHNGAERLCRICRDHRNRLRSPTTRAALAARKEEA